MFMEKKKAISKILINNFQILNLAITLMHLANIFTNNIEELKKQINY